MRIAIIFLLVNIIPMQAIAEELGAKEQSLMRDIVRNCGETPVLEFPRPETIYDRVLLDFQDYVRWFERDMNLLKDMLPNAENSTYKINGKQFKEHVAICKERINSNNKKIRQAELEQPPKEVQQAIENALWRCETVNKWIDNPKKFNATYEYITEYYNGYIAARDLAIRSDSRAATWKKHEFDACDNEFVPKFLKMKELKEKENKTKKAEEEATERRQQQEQKIIYERKVLKAKLLGFEGVQEGIMSLLDELNQGYSTIAGAKPYLIEPDYLDKFSVVGMVDNYVMYGFHRNSSEYIQVAVLFAQGRDQYLGDGAALPEGFYAVEGMREFLTVLGVRKQILVLRAVAE